MNDVNDPLISSKLLNDRSELSDLNNNKLRKYFDDTPHRMRAKFLGDTIKCHTHSVNYIGYQCFNSHWFVRSIINIADLWA